MRDFPQLIINKLYYAHTALVTINNISIAHDTQPSHCLCKQYVTTFQPNFYFSTIYGAMIIIMWLADATMDL